MQANAALEAERKAREASITVAVDKPIEEDASSDDGDYGVALPPTDGSAQEEEKGAEQGEQGPEIGVAMPPPVVVSVADPPTKPRAVVSEAPRSVGPALPQGMTRERLETVAEAYQARLAREDDDDEGPQLPGDYKMETLLKYQAAEDIRNQTVEKKRDDWMTVLPDERSMGLGADPTEALLNAPREFSRKGIKSRGDTSQWTDTPADRERKAMERQLGLIEAEQTAGNSKGDKKRMSDDHEDGAAYSRGTGSVNRGPSLLDEYNKSSAKKAKVDAQSKKGFSFDRDEDLTIRRSGDLNNVDKMKAGFSAMFESSGHEKGM